MKNELLAPNYAKPGTYIVKLSAKQASGVWGLRERTRGRP